MTDRLEAIRQRVLSGHTYGIAQALNDLMALLAECDLRGEQIDTLRHRAETAEQESEGRRVQLLAKADEARAEWTRAEQAEAELAVCRRALTGEFQAHRDLSNLKR